MMLDQILIFFLAQDLEHLGIAGRTSARHRAALGVSLPFHCNFFFVFHGALLTAFYAICIGHNILVNLANNALKS